MHEINVTDFIFLTRNKSLKNADRHFNCIAKELAKQSEIATCIIATFFSRTLVIDLNVLFTVIK